jgi:hypothetical protein
MVIVVTSGGPVRASVPPETPPVGPTVVGLTPPGGTVLTFPVGGDVVGLTPPGGVVAVGGVVALGPGVGLSSPYPGLPRPSSGPDEAPGPAVPPP